MKGVFIANVTSGDVSFSFFNSTTLSPEKIFLLDKDFEDTKKAVKRGEIQVHENTDDAIKHL
ncbi:MAG: hypothetical protein WCJ58_02020 [bacterium]